MDFISSVWNSGGTRIYISMEGSRSACRYPFVISAVTTPWVSAEPLPNRLLISAARFMFNAIGGENCLYRGTRRPSATKRPLNFSIGAPTSLM